ncbi:DUF2851 family protein [Chitinophaga silvatica]|nr:DUF2851 family protein [Chitinophaga silvatica]
MFVNLPLTEELFQHIWALRLFQQDNLTTTSGESLTILSPGRINRHAGPDFEAAKIRLGSVLWIGNVELHLRTSDWFRHHHQNNPQYQRIILHVVFVHDLPSSHHPDVPCLELQQYIPKILLQRYEQLRRLSPFVPCAPIIDHLPHLTWVSWKERLLAERWERKTESFKTWLECNNYNWEEVCYWALAQSYGTPVNAMPFLQLAQSVSYKILLRYSNNLLQMEALVFGQAGMLNGSFTDSYPLELQEIYTHMQHKHQLLPISADLWNWLRVRPSAFPTIRIATFASLLQQRPRLFSKLLEAESLKELEQLFSICPSPYWHRHYRFNQEVDSTQLPATQIVNNILINTVLPLLQLYGRIKQQTYYQQKAIDLLQQLPPEKNSITKSWKSIGVTAVNAFESQALLQLKRYYCEEKQCLKCAVGVKLLSECCGGFSQRRKD